MEFQRLKYKGIHSLLSHIPAMMIPQIARTLIEEYIPQEGAKLILDPYMGSGTSLVEASIKGIDVIGTDINPLARLISKVKTTHYKEKYIQYNFSVIQSYLSEYKEELVEKNALIIFQIIAIGIQKIVL